MKKKISTLLFTLIVFSLAAAGCSSSASSVATTPASTGTVIPEAGKTAVAIKSNTSTIAEAAVVPIQSANLNFNTAGTVEQILKPEGSEVKKDDPIAILQGQERLEAALASAQLAQASAKQTLTKLQDSGKLNKAAAALKVANADKALKDAKNDTNNAEYKRGTRDQINEAQARYLVAEDAFKTANDNYADLAGQSDDDLTKAYALTQLGQARQHRDKAQADLNYLQNLPDSYDVSIVQSKLDVAQANLDAAKSDQAKLNADGLNPDDLAVAQANLTNANAQEAAAQSALDDLTLKAPFDGSIIANNLKVGEAVSTSSQQAQVVLANTTSWQVETSDLTELNINAIHEGNPVSITFDAVPGLTLTGKVLRIQSLGTNKQGDITYKVTVALDKQDERLRWNMTALVTFNTQP